MKEINKDAPFNPDGRGRAPMPDYLIEAQTTTWNLILPFLKRNASAFEIVELLGLTPNQVHQAIHNKDRKLRRFDEYFDPERVAERARRWERRTSERNARKFPSRHQANSIMLAKEILARYSIDEKIHIWQTVSDTFRRRDKFFPQDFSYGLVLQNFWIAKTLANEGDDTFLREYVEIGRDLDEGWFNMEEMNSDRRLITEALASGLRNPSRVSVSSLIEYGEVNSGELGI